MEPDQAKGRSTLTFALAGLAVALVGAVAGWQLAAHRGAGSKAEIEQVVRAYILEHPEILPEAMERLRTRETQK